MIPGEHILNLAEIAFVNFSPVPPYWGVTKKNEVT